MTSAVTSLHADVTDSVPLLVKGSAPPPIFGEGGGRRGLESKMSCSGTTST